ncbi:MAG: carbamoyl-phosphate synthase large subunit [Gammaproteobacteria bacterium]|nr:carbamoyl-phosphate synthase large subunit [Gammaproteobacteria bacterium]
MPRRADLHSVLIIGAGPITIGQACEFDYSGVQACKALAEENYRVILVNSNPATIMTDPDFADATYIEPINWRTLARVIEAERPDALLPTMGGQTGLNCALDLQRHGVLERFGVEMIGADSGAIDKAEDRQLFAQAMRRIGLETVRGGIARNLEQARAVAETVGFPAIIRPSFTLGGSGGGVAYNAEEFDQVCRRGLEASPTAKLLIEESILGWKEFEMEVVRDHRDNCIIVCSIENFDPMGVHTGDSITVAPAQTLSDKEYQIMRDASIAVLREIGVDTGGSNVQFAVNPDDGRMIIIEMNPRVSRSSALASKATGFPIARVAAKLAVGFTLDELANDITGGATPASFEPTIDYVVTKIPRFDFEKFPQADATLTTQMKSVGEVMAIGRTFQESFHKALRALEIGADGLDQQSLPTDGESTEEGLAARLRVPGAKRPWHLAEAFRHGLSVEQIHAICKIDPWFLAQLEDLVSTESDIAGRAPAGFAELEPPDLRAWKQKGFSDRRIARLMNADEAAVREFRHRHGIHPVFKRVDSCAAEFNAATAYLYSSYDSECEAAPTARQKIIILGGGPNRIGQGIEFDYCCVHAAMALREDNYETIMVNCNPETVSTDYDTSDRLYFEPLTLEDVLEIARIEKPAGVIVQYGGQTPLKLARALEAAGVPIIGTSPQSIHQAEDRAFFQQLLRRLGLLQPPNRTATQTAEALTLADEIGYPLVVRPSYVLGGRAMEIVHHPDDLRDYMNSALLASFDSPVLLDRFLGDATEVDVDAICDGQAVLIGGIMEHIEAAGVHSGDSACSLPPFSLPPAVQDQLRRQTRELALALNVVGLMNVQFAVKGADIYVLEVNPRASRTVPFVSKATSRPLAKIAARCMAGVSLAQQGVSGERIPPFYSVKEAVFPFIKFPGVDTVLGPEMKSTGEVMGVGGSFGEAFGKAQQAVGLGIPRAGRALLSVKTEDQAGLAAVAGYLSAAGFELVATEGTAAALSGAGLCVERVNKVKEGRPHVVDRIKNDQFHLIINTTAGKQSLKDSYTIRREALLHKVTYFTTLAAARAAVEAHKSADQMTIHRLQTLHQQFDKGG